MNLSQTYPKPDKQYMTATQAAAPSEPTLNDSADEALKWLFELTSNLYAIERNLIGGINVPSTEKDVEKPFALEGKLRLISQQAASMVGFTSTILNKIS